MIEKLNPYTPCPCGSGKKVKFCCGKDKGNTYLISITDAQGNLRKIIAIPEYTNFSKEESSALQEVYSTLGKDAFYDVENIPFLEDVIARNPDSPKVKFHYANLLRESGNEQKSNEIIEQALIDYPNNYLWYIHKMLQVSFTDEIYVLFENFPWMPVIEFDDLIYFLYAIGGIRKKQGNEKLFKEIADIINVINPHDPVIAQYGDK